MGLLRYSNSEHTEIVDFIAVFDLGDTNTIWSGITMMLLPPTVEQVGHVGGSMVASQLERLERPLTRAAAWGLPLAMGQGNHGTGQVQHTARKWDLGTAT